jgi:hypothetical protein
LAAAPVAASYLIYYFWPPTRTVNYGELIEPRPLPDPQLALADGTAFRLSRLRGRWVLVSLDSGRCDERCDRKLLYMRQLRLTQGKDMERVERAWLISDDAVPRPARSRHPGTSMPPVGLLEQFRHAARPPTIYVIDPPAT